MPYLPVTPEQMQRWRAIYAERATPRLKALPLRARPSVMRMMQVAEQIAPSELSDDLCRGIFFHSTRPGFPLRDDETVAACRLMMRDAASRRASAIHQEKSRDDRARLNGRGKGSER